MVVPTQLEAQTDLLVQIARIVTVTDGMSNGSIQMLEGTLVALLVFVQEMKMLRIVTQRLFGVAAVFLVEEE